MNSKFIVTIFALALFALNFSGLQGEETMSAAVEETNAAATGRNSMSTHELINELKRYLDLLDEIENMKLIKSSHFNQGSDARAKRPILYPIYRSRVSD